MPSITLCPKCGKHFTDKNYAKHIARKIPCEPKKTKKINVKEKVKEDVKGDVKVDVKGEIKEDVKEEIKEEVKKEIKEEVKEDIITGEKNEIKSLFEKMEQTLYLDGIIGDKARSDITNLFALKLLEPKFENGIINIKDIKKNEYDKFEITEKNIEYCQFSKLATLNDIDLYEIFSKICRYVLSKHYITKFLFNVNEFLNVKNGTTLYNLVKDLNKISLKDKHNDSLSEIYQHFILKQFKGERGSKLGQHFTPFEIKRFIAKELANTFTENSTICDPFGGTSGFLVESYPYIKLKRNDPQNYFNSLEIDHDVHKYALTNILICTDQFCDKTILCGNAFVPTNKKYTHIMTNPPFGGIFKKDQIVSDWFATVKTNNRNLLTIQLLMKLLDNNGYCMMIWPYGNEMSSVRKAELEVRKKLIEEFKLEKIILLPKGIFEYTSIATVIIKFGTGKTDSVIFSKFDEKGEIDKAEFTKTLEEIKNKNYSLRLEDYIEKIKEKVGAKFEIKKLGDICSYLPKSKRQASYGKDNGKYPFYKSSMMLNSYVDEFDYWGESIIIGTGGYPSIHYDNKFSCSADNFILTIKKEIGIIIKYIYYYLLINMNLLEDGFHGVGIKHISIEYVKNLEIPVPSIEEQEKIVKDIDVQEEDKKSLQKAIEAIENQIKVLSEIKYKFKENVEIKKLGDICEIKNGNRITKNNCEKGDIPVFGGGNITFYTNKHNREGKTCKIGRFGISESNCVMLLNILYYLNDSGITVTSKNKLMLSDEYLWYYLLNQKEKIYSLSSGVAQKNLIMDQFMNLEIPVPSIEEQEKIVKMFDAKHQLIEELQEEINGIDDQLKKMFNDFINEN